MSSEMEESVFNDVDIEHLRQAHRAWLRTLDQISHINSEKAFIAGAEFMLCDSMKQERIIYAEQAAAESMRQELEEARKVIAFYAKENHWKLNRNNHAPLSSKCEVDLGDFARAHQAKWEGKV